MVFFVAETKGHLVKRVDLEPGGWSVFAVTPEMMAGLEVEASYEDGAA